MSTRRVSALFVEPGGPYANLEGVEVWDEERDARKYAGPHPVVAHPPCNHWSVAACMARQRDGKDGGCFSSALASVRHHGGVLEHPASTLAWEKFGIKKPPISGGWVVADWFDGFGGWTCCVAQRNYGHRATKRTWLYAVGVELPSLKWGDGPKSSVATAIKKEHRCRGGVERMGHRERSITPEPFRDILLSMARSCNRGSL